MAKWWECLPLNNVGWVCCWFSPCSKGFFRGSPVFTFLHKNQHFKFQFDQDRGPASKQAKDDVTSSLSISIYLFICLFMRDGIPQMWSERYVTHRHNSELQTALVSKSKNVKIYKLTSCMPDEDKNEVRWKWSILLATVYNTPNPAKSRVPKSKIRLSPRSRQKLFFVVSWHWISGHCSQLSSRFDLVRAKWVLFCTGLQ